MRVPREDLPPLRHELRLILEGQGPEACKQALEARQTGARLREHAEECADCADVVRELYGGAPIPVRGWRFRP